MRAFGYFTTTTTTTSTTTTHSEFYNISSCFSFYFHFTLAGSFSLMPVRLVLFLFLYTCTVYFLKYECTTMSRTSSCSDFVCVFCVYRNGSQAAQWIVGLSSIRLLNRYVCMYAFMQLY